MYKYKCKMCPIGHDTINKAAIHALTAHRNDHIYNVACMFENCLYTTRSWPAFRKHCLRHHNIRVNSFREQDPREIETQQDDTNDIAMEAVEVIPDPSPQMFDKFLTKFILSLETKHHMTRRGLAEMTGTVEEMVQQLSRKIQYDVKAAFQGGNDIDICQFIADSCNLDMSFLGSDYRRHNVYERDFHYLQPKPVYQGSKRATIAYYVPFRELVQLLCKQKEIWAYISTSEPPTSTSKTTLRDFGDGAFVQSKSQAKSGKPFLQVALFYDDLEMQNPLHSNKHHKLAMFYVSILNIPPMYRSKLQSIFAVAIAPVEKLKQYGFIVVLQDFLHTMRVLGSTGIGINQGCKEAVLHGDLIVALCDTPAAAALGGFKESSSFADHFCRTCMASKKTFMDKYTEQDFQVRDMATYDRQCKTLEDSSLTSRRAFWSKTYGVNDRSCLCAIPGFDVTKCLLQDPMHVILEGCLPYVLALFLQQQIFVDKVFTLKALNSFLQAGSTYKPEKGQGLAIIEKKHIKDEHIKQKASSMLTIAYMLPFFLGLFLDEDDARYNNLLCMIRITCTCFKPVVDATCAGVLGEEIAEFLKSFCEIYGPTKVKPKMHFMVHFPKQMLEFGPLRHHSTMRAEAKHGYFKDHRWLNFNNLPLSLLKRHQLSLAHALTDSQGNIVQNFLQENSLSARLTTGRPVKVGDMADGLREWLMNIFQLSRDTVLQEFESFNWRGRHYDNNCLLLLSECQVNGPCYGKIEKVYTLDSCCYALISSVVTQEFCARFNAYRIETQVDSLQVVDLAKLAMSWAFPINAVKDEKYVVSRYGIMT